jgi:hypothetical protein
MIVASLTRCHCSCPLEHQAAQVCNHPTAVERRGPPTFECEQLPSGGTIPATCPLRDGEFLVRLAADDEADVG